jgi:hypothetical protein
MADYFAAYAAQIAASIHCDVAVTALRRKPDGTGFHGNLRRPDRGHQCHGRHRTIPARRYPASW